jgi:hypothetical protein
LEKGINYLQFDGHITRKKETKRRKSSVSTIMNKKLIWTLGGKWYA